MLLETEKEDQSELEVIGIVIQSGKLSTEEVGFGLRDFEPTPHLEGHQVGGEAPPRSPPATCPAPEVDEVTVEISGYVGCGCVESGPSSVIIDVTGANGTWVIPRYDTTNFVLFSAFTVPNQVFPGVSDCSGEPVTGTPIDITIQVNCNPITNFIFAIENFTPFGPPFLFGGGGSPIVNGGTYPNNGAVCGDSSVFGEGGEVVISW